MSLFMDVHTIEAGVSAADVAKAHQADLEMQTKYGVSYLRYWVDEGAGKIFCLVEADDAQSAKHRPSRGPWPRGRRGLSGVRVLMRTTKKGRKMKKLLTSLTTAMVLSLMLVAPVNAQPIAGDRFAQQIGWAKVVQEKNEADAPDPVAENIGWSRLVRSKDGLRASVFMQGLEPGGVYTFWWVIPHDFDDNGDPIIPGGVFVAGGAGVVIDESGMAMVRMRARTDQPGIEGFPALDGAEWHALTDPLGSVVRVEIAYHGQAEDANGDLKTWLSDFWTGTACPEQPGGVNEAGQAHCPVYLAATHLP